MENKRRELLFLARLPENSDPTPTPPCANPPTPASLHIVIPTEGPRRLRAEVEGSRLDCRLALAAGTILVQRRRCAFCARRFLEDAPQISPACKGWDWSPLQPTAL